MKRIAFRMVWIALLAGGMTLLMTPDKNADAENAAENTAEKAPDSLAAAPGEPDAAQGSKSAENSGENTGSDSIDAVPTIDLEAKALATAQDTAWKLLLGLSPKIATIPEPVDTVLGEELSLLAHQDADKKLNLRGKLSEPESAGKFIHDLRKRSFLPASTVKWHSHKIESDRVSELIGSVTLKDGRARAFKAHLDLQTGLVTSYSRPSIQELGGQELVNTVFAQLKAGDAQAVWTQASPELRKHRNAGELLADIQAERLLEAITIEWEKDTAIEGGFRLIGVANLANDETIPFYAALLDSPDGLRLLDVQSTSGFTNRLFNGRGDTLDITLAVVALGLLLGFLYILFSYGIGLRGSPRELYILFFTKVTEYSAYGAAQLAFMFYLREDMGLSEISAGSYYSVWSTGLTLLTMMVGAVCDAIGIKRTLLIGSVALLISRGTMPFTDSLMVATIIGWVPLAVGIAITGPVLSVGIKRYTTREGAALGFGLFYTLMNVGWAVGAWLFDKIRVSMGDTGGMEVLGFDLSTYQVIIGVGFFINLPDLMAILLMRKGVEMTERGVHIEKEVKSQSEEGVFATTMQSIKSAGRDTMKIFGENFVQRAFWVFILLIGITVFARLTFFHFHITWPSYGLRYFGQGSLVGNIFGVLNPVMIVFMVPVLAFLTRKVSSYWMLLVGTIISVGSIFFVVVPVDSFAWMADTWFGTIIFDRWLEVPIGFRDPFYLSMVLFVMAFTVGEAIWSPRLMQFTAEIAPPGREGSYVALAYLPYFGAKFIAGPMAGLLLSNYAPEFGIAGEYGSYPDHQMIWWWIGGTAALTPFGLIGFRKLYRTAEVAAERAADEAAAIAEAEDRAAGKLTQATA